HYVDLQARERGGSAFLVSAENDRAFTYGDLKREALALAAFLGTKGIRKGDKVGFYCSNGWQTAAIFLGTMYGGFVSVPLNLLSPRSQLHYVLVHSELKLVFADAAPAPRLPAGLPHGIGNA